MRKKILVIDSGNEWGGGTISLLKFILSQKDNFEFHVVFYKNYSNGTQKIGDVFNKHKIKFCVLHTNPSSFYKPLKELARLLTISNKKTLFHLERSFLINKRSCALTGLISDIKPDLIYTNNQFSSNLDAILASAKANVPIVCHIRKETLLRSFEVKQSNKIISKAIYVSNHSRHHYELQGISPARGIVIYNGIEEEIPLDRTRINIAKEEVCYDDGSIYIGILGSLVPIKNHKRFLCLAREIIQNYERSKFVVVGDGPERPNLIKIAKKLGISDRVFFVGFQVSPFEYISLCDVMVVTSVDEGCPRSVLEAMAMEKPVVSFDVGGIRELIEQGQSGFLVKPSEDALFVEAVTRLLRDSQLSRSFGKAGRKIVSDKFTLNRYVHQLSSALQDVPH